MFIAKISAGLSDICCCWPRNEHLAQAKADVAASEAVRLAAGPQSREAELDERAKKAREDAFRSETQEDTKSPEKVLEELLNKYQAGAKETKSKLDKAKEKLEEVDKLIKLWALMTNPKGGYKFCSPSGQKNITFRYVRKSSGDAVIQYWTYYGPRYGLNPDWIDPSMVGWYFEGKVEEPILKRRLDWNKINSDNTVKELLFNEAKLASLATSQDNDILKKKAVKILSDATRTNIFLSRVSADKLQKAKSKAGSDLTLTDVNRALLKDINTNYKLITTNPTEDPRSILIKMFRDLHILSWIAASVDITDSDEEDKKYILCFCREFLISQANYLSLVTPKAQGNPTPKLEPQDTSRGRSVASKIITESVVK